MSICQFQKVKPSILLERVKEKKKKGFCYVLGTGQPCLRIILESKGVIHVITLAKE